MPALTDTALCLRRWDFSETSQTVSLFTRAHGIVRGLAKGAKRERGKFSGGFDVLTSGSLVAYLKAGRDLATLAEWHVIELYRYFREDLEANRAGLLLMDLLHHLLTDHDPHPALYDSIDAQLRRMRDPDAVGPALLVAQWTLLVDTGYRPQLTGGATEDVDVMLFDPALGGLAGSADPARSWRVRRSTVEMLRTLESGGDGTGHPETVHRANRLLATYAREIAGRELPAIRWAFETS